LSGYDYHIYPFWQTVLVETVNLPQTPADTVAANRVSDLCADCYADLVEASPRLSEINNDSRSRYTFTFCIEPAELMVLFH